MHVILRFIVNILLSFDQLFNTYAGGHPDESMSSRLGRTIGKERYFWVKYMRVIVDSLFFFDREVDEDTGKILRHCEKSIMPLEQQNFREMIDYEIWDWTRK